MSDPLLEALAQQKQYFNQNNFWGQAGDALGAVSTAYGQNQDEGSNPNSNLVGALLTGIGSGFMKGYGQQEVRRQTADFANVLRGVAKDYYSGGDLSSVYNSPYQALQDAAPALEFGRMQSQQERQNKLNDSMMGKGLSMQFAPNGQPIGAQPIQGFGEAEAVNSMPAKALDYNSQIALMREKQNLENQAKGLIDPKESRSAEDTLRNDLWSKSGIQDLRTIDQAYNSMLKNLYNNTGAADYDYIYGTAKALDPNSVVREGEQVNMTRTDGIFGDLNAMLGTLKSEGKLDVGTRQRLAQIVGTRRDEALKTYNQVLGDVGKVAQNRNLNMQNVNIYGNFKPSNELYNPVPYAPDYSNRQQVVAQNTAPTQPQNFQQQQPVTVPQGMKAQVNSKTGQVRFVPK